MRRHLLTLVLLAATAAPALPSASGQASPPVEPAVEPYPYESWFEMDAAPSAPLDGPAAAADPFGYAVRRIGLDLAAFELPRAHENSYRFDARLPLIDAVANRPLYMKSWTEAAAAEIERTHREGGLAALDVAEFALREARGRPGRLRAAGGGDGEEEGGEADELQAELASWLEQLAAAPLAPAYRADLARLLAGVQHARALARQGCRGLAPEELAAFEADPGGYLAPGGERMVDLTGGNDSVQEFIARARHVDMASIFGAAAELRAATTAYVAATRAWGPRDFLSDTTRSSEPIVLAGPTGRVVIAGPGADEHAEDALVLIDLGGDDVYTNDAGACIGPAAGAALLIDHGGHDRYLTGDRRYVQGFACLGAALLVDLAGDDVYQAGHFAQGAAVLGVAALWDAGGDDRYQADTFCQGAGMFGVGALLDDDGEDFYDCASLGQGAATCLGFGLLSDLAGDDRYHLAVRPGADALGGNPGYGQGGALSFRPYPWRGRLTPYGGVGFLSDSSGNDRYRSRGWCDQGGSYIMSLGALVDGAGNDHYSAGTGQGSGIHITNAILIDRGGHDLYEGEFRCGGSGSDNSPGFLIDYAGDDEYRSKAASYGTACKPRGLSLLLDYAGDDRYVCPNPAGAVTMNNWDSFGGIWPESEVDTWPYAIHLDLGGRDDYQVRNRANDSERASFGHGLHLDMEWTGGDLLAAVASPLAPYAPRAGQPGEAAVLPHADLVDALRYEDTFARFAAVGRLVEAGPAAVPALCAALRASSHRGLNRDLLECLHLLLAGGAIGEAERPAVRSLLAAADPEVRQVIADDLGIWPDPGAESALVAAAAGDPAPGVRRFALASLRALESKAGLPLARELAGSDPDPSVRRTALAYLTLVRDRSDDYPLLAARLETDPAPAVRVAAAAGIGRLADERGLEPLRRAARSHDAYLQRAAGEALARLGRIEGIELLIESLAFPSIDAFVNYNRNVPNTIAALTGHDFAESERYDRERWRAWLAAHRETIDIRANLATGEEFRDLEEGAAELPRDARLAAYEKFVAAHPNWTRAGRDLAALLNQAAWEMATAARTDPAFDPATAVRHAARAVELDDQPAYVDTLAEAHLAAGDPARARELCLAALEDHPGEAMFLERLERIAALEH